MENKIQLTFVTKVATVDEEGEFIPNSVTEQEIKLLKFNGDKFMRVICRGQTFIIRPELLIGMVSAFSETSPTELVTINETIVAENKMLRNALEICFETLKKIY